jgi:2-polyprenyl-6-hydroxyphenyl methylase/3-demethylubiquinone-9 3-methyltransferase
MSTESPHIASTSQWNHSSDPNFSNYYEQQSVSDETVQRFSLVRDKALQLLGANAADVTRVLEVVDVGCGAGTQSRLWAEMGHRVHGLDVNAPLINVARRRAAESGLEIAFDVGSATELPYADSSMDVALLPELLEHVANWQGCLDEAIRVLKPGGLLYLSTTSWLCPKQQEFNLPLYSWYPAFLKRRYERLAVTTRPEIANHCKYPAVNWFSFYALERYLGPRGFACLDRFDMVELRDRSALAKTVLTLVRGLAPLRLLGHVLTPGSTIFALKAQ